MSLEINNNEFMTEIKAHENVTFFVYYFSETRGICGSQSEQIVLSDNETGSSYPIEETSFLSGFFSHTVNNYHLSHELLLPLITYFRVQNTNTRWSWGIM